MDQAERDSLPYVTVAIIDDDIRLAQLVKVVLEEANQSYDVQVDGDVVRAYDFIKRVRPDLIILDIMMGVDAAGFQTLQKLSQDPDLCPTPVVVSSAGIFPKDLYQEFKSPIVFLPKPFQLTELVQTVHSMVLNSRGASLR